jgi:Flp pilus assembly protein TadG
VRRRLPDPACPCSAGSRRRASAPSPCLRKGAVLVESAFVYPLLFLMLFGLIVGGMGIYRYQAVACMAREAVRYASVRGSDWQVTTNQKSPTQEQIAQTVVAPLAVAMDTTQLTTTVELINGVSGTATAWDNSNQATTSLNANGQPVANRVRVTITYNWYPELLLGGPIALQSVSETPMSF